MKKLLVVVPHQDDDISIAGALLAACREPQAEYEPFVLFTTNGDASECNGLPRLREAQHALAVLGVDTQHILFLGYPDTGRLGKTLYECDENELFIHHGRKQTYGLPEAPEYRWQNSCKHSDYTKNNYRCDLHDAISDILPDCIIVNNYDDHPDHRMAYLMTLEVVRKLIIEQPGYRPLLLTKYAYANNWFGENDYFEQPLQPTMQTYKCDYNIEYIENPEAKWQDRLCFSVPECCKTPRLRENLLFKALQCHVSQEAWFFAPRFINSDVCYWRKHTENLALLATATATSGRSDYVNDFKVLDSSRIFPSKSVFDRCVWSPDKEDGEKVLRLRWDIPVCIDRVVLYENADPDQHIRTLLLQMDNGFCMKNIEPALDGSATEICFIRQEGIRELCITLTDIIGDEAGLSEVEVFEGRIPLKSYNFPLKQIPQQEARSETKTSIEKYIFEARVLFCRKLFPNIYVMRYWYPFLVRCPLMLPVFWLWRLLSRRERVLFRK